MSFEIIPKATPTPADERTHQIQHGGWGRVFTDHMVTIRYNEDRGWHSARVEPRRPFELDPAVTVLHYAQEIFEGLKAYRLPDGGATLFRPDANARRFQQSAERLAMPTLPVDVFIESVEQLTAIDNAWIPPADEGATLYLRPFMIGTEPALGTRPSAEYIYSVVASPVLSYFKGKGTAVSVWVSRDYVRAAPGGTGAAKCGGNYAASLAALAQAQRADCEQVVFLDAVERRWIEELGGMNIFFVFDDGSLLTPPLTGTILPGVTRDSLITLARDLGHVVREEAYSIDQWLEDAKSGRLREVFACGTAAVITPIGLAKSTDFEITIGDGQAGPITQNLKTALTDIQFGRAPDRFNWLRGVDFSR